MVSCRRDLRIFPLPVHLLPSEYGLGIVFPQLLTFFYDIPYSVLIWAFKLKYQLHFSQFFVLSQSFICGPSWAFCNIFVLFLYTIEVFSYKFFIELLFLLGFKTFMVEATWVGFNFRSSLLVIISIWVLFTIVHLGCSALYFGGLSPNL